MSGKLLSRDLLHPLYSLHKESNLLLLQYIPRSIDEEHFGGNMAGVYLILFKIDLFEVDDSLC